MPCSSASCPSCPRTLEFLQQPGRAELPEGRLDLDGERVFALVQRYRTEVQAQPLLEHHRRYLDVQAVVAGAEAMVWAPRASLRLTQPYDVERDAALGRVPAQDLSWLQLRPGLVAVFFPDDAHAGRLAVDEPGAVTKIVVKVAIAPE
jgi:biofilm protein TabA